MKFNFEYMDEFGKVDWKVGRDLGTYELFSDGNLIGIVYSENHVRLISKSLNTYDSLVNELALTAD